MKWFLLRAYEAAGPGLRRDVPVRVDLYDVSGRRVRTLFDAERSAGRGSVAWDGRLADGRTAASGVYFVRLRAGSLTATRKIVRVD